MAIGSRRGQKKAHLQYVGITKDLSKRFNGKHPIQLAVRAKSLRLFIGIVTSQAVAGRKAGHQAKNFTVPLYLAESALAFLMEIPLNKDKRCSPPNDSIVVVNRWFHSDFATRRRKRPHTSWPDLVEYDCHEHMGDLAWHGRRREHINSGAILKLQQRAKRALLLARTKNRDDEIAIIGINDLADV